MLRVGDMAPGCADDYEDDEDEEAPAAAEQPGSSSKGTVSKLAEQASDAAGVCSTGTCIDLFHMKKHCQ